VKFVLPKLALSLILALVVGLVLTPQSVSALTTIFSDDFSSATSQDIHSYNSDYVLFFDGSQPVSVYNGQVSYAHSDSRQFVRYHGAGSIADQCSTITGVKGEGLLGVGVRFQAFSIGSGFALYTVWGNTIAGIPWHSYNTLSFENTAGVQENLGYIDFNADVSHTYKACVVGNHLTFSIDGVVYDERDGYVVHNDLTPISAGYPTFSLGGPAYVTSFSVDGANPNETPSVGTVTVTPNPVQVNSPVSASVLFTDVNTGDSHTASASWGDNSSDTSCTVTESNGSGSVSCPRPSGYATADVYPVTVTVTDGSLTGANTYRYLAVYDPAPSSHFNAVTRFTSPAGSSIEFPNATGPVKFGVQANYQNSIATGDAKMYFQAANIDFVSVSITSLVTANGKATLRGRGTINETGDYDFLVTGIDGNNPNGKIRFQLKEHSSGNLVYDSQPAETDDAADPTASITGTVQVQ
jgi:hypothetical protein